MEQENNGINISNEIIDSIILSPRLFPEVVKALGGTSLDNMQQVRDELNFLISRRQMNAQLDVLEQASASASIEDSPWVR